MQYFARDISVPLSNIFNTMFTEGGYPEMWKTEFITPIPKNYNSVSKMSEFRPISALYNCAKISDKIMASYITQDMAKDTKQYGNEKGLSVNHYLIKMIHKILVSVDKNSNFDQKSVILSMLDWKGDFENKCHF